MEQGPPRWGWRSGIPQQGIVGNAALGFVPLAFPKLPELQRVSHAGPAQLDKPAVELSPWEDKCHPPRNSSSLGTGTDSASPRTPDGAPRHSAPSPRIPGMIQSPIPLGQDFPAGHSPAPGKCHFLAKGRTWTLLVKHWGCSGGSQTCSWSLPELPGSALTAPNSSHVAR